MLMPRAVNSSSSGSSLGSFAKLTRRSGIVILV
jgi:hypothetical protein